MGARSLIVGIAMAISAVLFGQEKTPPDILMVPYEGLPADKVWNTQQQWADFLERPISETNPVGMTLVLIPPGEFDLGIREDQEPEVRLGEPAPDTNERGYRVRLTRPFLMSAFEVTEKQYRYVVSRGKVDISDNRPAYAVSFFDAVEFCNRLSEMCEIRPFYKIALDPKNGVPQVSVLGGGGYRLPSDAEWEYACRAGTVTHYSFGDSCNGCEAHVNRKRPFGNTSALPYETFRPIEIGSFAPNAFGLFDMHGNVEEWVDEQWVTARRTDVGIAADPQQRSDGRGRMTLRGGSAFKGATYARSSARSHYDPAKWQINYGIRVARSIEDETR